MIENLGLITLYKVVCIIKNKHGVTCEGHYIEIYPKNVDRDVKEDLDCILKKLAWEKKVINIMSYPQGESYPYNGKYQILILPGFEEYRQKIMQEYEAINKDEKDEKILELTKQCNILNERVKTLEEAQWDGFDESSPTYPEELDTAMQAHRSVSFNYDKEQPIKPQIITYLQQKHPKLSPYAMKRIATVSNWDKNGGAPPKSRSNKVSKKKLEKV